MEKGNPTKTVLMWTVGIASVAFILLLMAVIFGNLSGNTGIPNSTSTLTVTNETNAYLNETGYTLSGYNSSWSTITLTALWNVSASGNYNITVGTGNATETTGVLYNATSPANYTNVSVSYTYVYSYPSAAANDAEGIIGNYTTGAVNTATQFPTIGTILGVALLILVLLALLVYVITKMGNLRSKNSGSFG